MQSAPEAMPTRCKPRSLGLLISSTQFRGQLLELAESACAKGIALQIHLIAEAVMLARDPCFHELRACGRVTVCLESARAYGIAETLQNVKPPVLVPCRRFADLLLACDRHLAF